MDPYQHTTVQKIWQRVGLVGPQVQTEHFSQQIAQMILQKQHAAQLYTALSRSTHGSCAQTLGRIAQQEAVHMRQLRAIYYVLTGQQSLPSRTPLPHVCFHRTQLRQCICAEQANSQAYQNASAQMPDYQTVFLQLAQEDAQHAATILSMLARTL